MRMVTTAALSAGSKTGPTAAKAPSRNLGLYVSMVLIPYLLRYIGIYIGRYLDSYEGKKICRYLSTSLTTYGAYGLVGGIAYVPTKD